MFKQIIKHLGEAQYAVLFASISLLSITTPVWADFSGTATLTSDYVWRGSSQTLEKPAVQGSMKYSQKNGLYASVWGSNVKYETDLEAGSEFDLAAGWSGVLDKDWTLDVYLLRYVYPGSNFDLDWTEVNTNLIWQQNYWIGIGHSTNAMATENKGTYFSTGVKYPIWQNLRLEGALAHYRINTNAGNGYTYGMVSAIWGFAAPFEARLTWHSTDNQAKQLFPGLAGSRAEFALQTTF